MVLGVKTLYTMRTLFSDKVKIEIRWKVKSHEYNFNDFSEFRNEWIIKTMSKMSILVRKKWRKKATEEKKTRFYVDILTFFWHLKKKSWKNYFSILQLVCKIFAMCGFKILFAVVTVSMSVIIKNKSSTFSCSLVKTLNNKILIGKKIW